MPDRPFAMPHSTFAMPNRPTLRTAAVILIATGMLLLAAGYVYLRASLPPTTGTIAVTGIGAPVDIVRDADGIPHIRAASDRDAFLALGFVHAQDRLWQMEFQRRVASGRLAEILGESALKTDQFLRTLGPRRAAEAAWSHVSPRGRDILEAYAAGVNAWLATRPTLPPEFTILGARPAPWTPVDSLAWAKMMAWDLGGNWDEDLLRARLAQAVGPQRATALMPAYPASGATILSADEIPAPFSDNLLEIDNRLQIDLGLGGRDVGSNNWVISGKLTASGRPLLANDPHLGTRIPSPWYLASLRGDRLHAVGATIPGLPAVLLGHNDSIAWGATNLGPDVQDLYVERINPAEPNQYAFGDRWSDMAIVEEVIEVAGRDEPVRWAARATRHGPLLSDVSDSAAMPLALRWTALDPADTTVDAFIGIDYARNWDEFLAAARLLVAPGQNFVYADVDGNIGYTATGRIPIRADGAGGTQPLPGWPAGDDWTGWVPFDQLPRAFNPPDGIIVTANNRVVDNGYPYHLASTWAPPYRAARISDLIAAKTKGGRKLTVDDLVAIQGDQTSAQARELLPYLVAITPTDERQAQAMDLLRGWDGDLAAGSAAAAIYSAWFIQLGRTLLEDDLHGDLYESFSARTHPIFLAEAFNKHPADPWCDNVLSAPRETCADAAREALDLALDDLGSRLGRGMDRWRWGDAHQTQLNHQPFSDVALLKPFFHRRIPSGGDVYTVNVAPVRLDRPYEQHKAPGYRQIIDLADWDGSRFIQVTGQSGHPLSAHYDDFIARHQQMDYAPMTFGGAAGGDRLVLRPAAGSRLGVPSFSAAALSQLPDPRAAQACRANKPSIVRATVQEPISRCLGRRRHEPPRWHWCGDSGHS